MHLCLAFHPINISGISVFSILSGPDSSEAKSWGYAFRNLQLNGKAHVNRTIEHSAKITNVEAGLQCRKSPEEGDL